MYIPRKEIERVINPKELLVAIHEGFQAFSRGEAVAPSVGQLCFEEPSGEVHIKYGYRKKQPYYVVKVASSFPHSSPSSNGVMLLFSQEKGELLAILHDEGFLTDLRTGLAGALSVQLLAPSAIDCIGVIGTGMQAFYQLLCVQHVTACRDVMVWGRKEEHVQQLMAHPELQMFSFHKASSPEQVARECPLLFTVTSSRAPLLFAEAIRPGTHIVAIGADSPGKQELDPQILAKADLVVVDSRAQSISMGELQHGSKEIQETSLEIGQLKRPFERKGSEITVFDSTGVAIQDVVVASAVYDGLPCTVSRKTARSSGIPVPS